MKNVILNNVIKNEDIYFSEPVKNTVIAHSTFRRIMYSNQFISLNNILILLKLENIKIIKFYQKYKCIFNTDNNTINNSSIIDITNIEKNILSKIKLNTKIPKFSILEQVRNCFIKFSTNNFNIDYTNSNKINIFLKISGIWENESEYGLTYKFYVD